ncbi:hypothetical protein CAPTEDRAFT_219878 [Capitella teleta]|uniref:BTB domain-containing protein n=1 Tax=Capitella teleta TaxID=283909 RepID=R7ULT1_CAPTE|nr:hypothetical protein CAPTEDRAFT_219878 [Capitella teleta]|eukprot:ELU04237.1 hypothetical protein CAPTEDRAFT_219878 [Capitella teleta]
MERAVEQPIKRLSTHDHNWQQSCQSVRERNTMMYNNELMADCHFLVGRPPRVERIPAHKYVLATGSSVFFAMFYGSLADHDENAKDVEIPEVEPVAFLNLLKYLYCDVVEPEPDSVLATLYVAKKYMVPHLARQCVQFLETSLTCKNACVLLSQSRLFEEPELMNRCWEVIDAQAEEALASEGFTEMDYDSLEMVLGRETLNVKEISLFQAAVRWAEVECSRREIANTSGNKRKVLGKALQLIRIPSMKLDEFADSAAQSGILTLQETNDVFLYFTAQNKPDVPFVQNPRRGLQPQRCRRFLSSAYRSNQWRYRGRCDSIQFSVDKRIFVAGFGLYGSSNGAAEYKATIELKRNGVQLGQTKTKFYADGSSSTFAVYFENPIQVDPEAFNTASVILDGMELSYFGQEGIAELMVGNVNFQFQCSSDSTNGTGVQGGQIPELIFYC